jgi:WD40 repeat protein
MQVFQLEVDYAYCKFLAFAPDGRRLAVGAKVFTLIDTIDGTLRPVPEIGCATCDVAFVGGGALAFTPVLEGLKILDPATGRKYEKTGHFFALAGAPKVDAFFASVVRVQPKKSYIVRLATADLSERGRFAKAPHSDDRLAISADGCWLAGQSVNVSALRVWNVGGRKLPSRPSMTTEFAGMRDLALSANGEHLAAVNSRGLTLWNTATGEQVVHSGKHRRGVTAIACSPTKPLLATGDNAGNVFFWDYTGRVLTRYDWGLGEVRALVFAPDGLRCAAVDAKGKVVVWDVDA